MTGRSQSTQTSAAPLSVIILTYDEEKNLPECLSSVRELNCDIFVVDSGSTDRTLAIACAAGAYVTAHPFENYAAQRNWAQEHLPIRSDWVLHLDADERLTPELVRELQHVLGAPPPGVDGFLLRKRTVFMGRWIRHGGHYPSYHVRVFRFGKGVCEDRLYDQHFLVHGKMATLRHDYIDVVASDVATWTNRHVRWAQLEAREILKGETGGVRVVPDFWGTAVERRRWLRQRLFWRLPLFGRAFAYGAYRYFIRFGFLDGVEGLVFHFLQGCWYRFLIDVYIHEYRSNAGAASRELPCERC